VSTLTTKSESKQKFSKSAFVDAAKDGKERLLLMTLLEDEKSYAKEEVAKILKDWKSKVVNDDGKKEVEA
jgi:hypothetical protein